MLSPSQPRNARNTASSPHMGNGVAWYRVQQLILKSKGAFYAAECRWPHDRQIAPTCLMSVSFDISFSRTREVKVLFFHICILKDREQLAYGVYCSPNAILPSWR